MAVNIQSVQLNAQDFRWSLNAAIFKTAAAATIDQELTKCGAVWWVLSSYSLVIPVSWVETSPAVLLQVKGGTFYSRTELREPTY